MHRYTNMIWDSNKKTLLGKNGVSWLSIALGTLVVTICLGVFVHCIMDVRKSRQESEAQLTKIMLEKNILPLQFEIPNSSAASATLIRLNAKSEKIASKIPIFINRSVIVLEETAVVAGKEDYIQLKAPTILKRGKRDIFPFQTTHDEVFTDRTPVKRNISNHENSYNNKSNNDLDTTEEEVNNTRTKRQYFPNFAGHRKTEKTTTIRKVPTVSPKRTPKILIQNSPFGTNLNKSSTHLNKSDSNLNKSVKNKAALSKEKIPSGLGKPNDSKRIPKNSVLSQELNSNKTNPRQPLVQNLTDRTGDNILTEKLKSSKREFSDVGGSVSNVSSNFEKPNSSEIINKTILSDTILTSPNKTVKEQSTQPNKVMFSEEVVHKITHFDPQSAPETKWPVTFDEESQTLFPDAVLRVLKKQQQPALTNAGTTPSGIVIVGEDVHRITQLEKSNVSDRMSKKSISSPSSNSSNAIKNGKFVSNSAKQDNETRSIGQNFTYFINGTDVNRDMRQTHFFEEKLNETQMELPGHTLSIKPSDVGEPISKIIYSGTALSVLEKTSTEHTSTIRENSTQSIGVKFDKKEFQDITQIKKSNSSGKIFIQSILGPALNSSYMSGINQNNTCFLKTVKHGNKTRRSISDFLNHTVGNNETKQINFSTKEHKKKQKKDANFLSNVSLDLTEHSNFKITNKNIISGQAPNSENGTHSTRVVLDEKVVHGIKKLSTRLKVLDSLERSPKNVFSGSVSAHLNKNYVDKAALNSGNSTQDTEKVVYGITHPGLFFNALGQDNKTRSSKQYFSNLTNNTVVDKEGEYTKTQINLTDQSVNISLDVKEPSHLERTTIQIVIGTFPHSLNKTVLDKVAQTPEENTQSNGVIFGNEAVHTTSNSYSKYPVYLKTTSENSLSGIAVSSQKNGVLVDEDVFHWPKKREEENSTSILSPAINFSSSVLSFSNTASAFSNMTKNYAVFVNSVEQDNKTSLNRQSFSNKNNSSVIDTRINASKSESTETYDKFYDNFISTTSFELEASTIEKSTMSIFFDTANKVAQTGENTQSKKVAYNTTNSALDLQYPDYFDTTLTNLRPDVVLTTTNKPNVHKSAPITEISTQSIKVIFGDEVVHSVEKPFGILPLDTVIFNKTVLNKAVPVTEENKQNIRVIPTEEISSTKKSTFSEKIAKKSISSPASTSSNIIQNDKASVLLNNKTRQGRNYFPEETTQINSTRVKTETEKKQANSLVSNLSFEFKDITILEQTTKPAFLNTAFSSLNNTPVEKVALIKEGKAQSNSAIVNKNGVNRIKKLTPEIQEIEETTLSHLLSSGCDYPKNTDGEVQDRTQIENPDASDGKSKKSISSAAFIIKKKESFKMKKDDNKTTTEGHYYLIERSVLKDESKLYKRDTNTEQENTSFIASSSNLKERENSRKPKNKEISFKIEKDDNKSTTGIHYYLIERSVLKEESKLDEKEQKDTNEEQENTHTNLKELNNPQNFTNVFDKIKVRVYNATTKRFADSTTLTLVDKEKNNSIVLPIVYLDQKTTNKSKETEEKNDNGTYSALEYTTSPINEESTENNTVLIDEGKNNLRSRRVSSDSISRIVEKKKTSEFKDSTILEQTTLPILLDTVLPSLNNTPVDKVALKREERTLSNSVIVKEQGVDRVKKLTPEIQEIEETTLSHLLSTGCDYPKNTDGEVQDKTQIENPDASDGKSKKSISSTAFNIKNKESEKNDNKTTREGQYYLIERSVSKEESKLDKKEPIDANEEQENTSFIASSSNLKELNNSQITKNKESSFRIKKDDNKTTTGIHYYLIERSVSKEESKLDKKDHRDTNGEHENTSFNASSSNLKEPNNPQKIKIKDSFFKIERNDNKATTEGHYYLIERSVSKEESKLDDREQRDTNKEQGNTSFIALSPSLKALNNPLKFTNISDKIKVRVYNARTKRFTDLTKVTLVDKEKNKSSIVAPIVSLDQKTANNSKNPEERNDNVTYTAQEFTTSPIKGESTENNDVLMDESKNNLRSRRVTSDSISRTVKKKRTSKTKASRNAYTENTNELVGVSSITLSVLDEPYTSEKIHHKNISHKVLSSDKTVDTSLKIVKGNDSEKKNNSVLLSIVLTSFIKTNYNSNFFTNLKDNTTTNTSLPSNFIDRALKEEHTIPSRVKYTTNKDEFVGGIFSDKSSSPEESLVQKNVLNGNTSIVSKFSNNTVVDIVAPQTQKILLNDTEKYTPQDFAILKDNKTSLIKANKSINYNIPTVGTGINILPKNVIKQPTTNKNKNVTNMKQRNKRDIFYNKFSEAKPEQLKKKSSIHTTITENFSKSAEGNKHIETKNQIQVMSEENITNIFEIKGNSTNKAEVPILSKRNIPLFVPITRFFGEQNKENDLIFNKIKPLYHENKIHNKETILDKIVIAKLEKIKRRTPTHLVLNEVINKAKGKEHTKTILYGNYKTNYKNKVENQGTILDKIAKAKLEKMKRKTPTHLVLNEVIDKAKGIRHTKTIPNGNYEADNINILKIKKFQRRSIKDIMNKVFGAKKAIIKNADSIYAAMTNALKNRNKKRTVLNNQKTDVSLFNSKDFWVPV